MKKNATLVGAAVLGLAALPVAQAQVISWNLDNYGTVSGNNVAGVVAAANWNNSWPDNPTISLIDSTGAATTLNLSYSSFNSYHIQGSHPGVDADGTYNRELLNGYLNSGAAAWNPWTTTSSFTLSQIPYSQYDVYVYFSADTAGRTGSLTDGTTTFGFSTLGSAAVSGASALFVETTDTTGAFPLADYAVFKGETASSLTITCTPLSGNDQWLGIAGFQVVPVPEPSALALGLGGLLLAAIRARGQR
jgi:hypothetical protein